MIVRIISNILCPSGARVQGVPWCRARIVCNAVLCTRSSEYSSALPQSASDCVLLRMDDRHFNRQWFRRLYLLNARRG